MSQRSAGSTTSGFQGAIESLPLVDLLQVWAMNRFSGLVSVKSQGRMGHLYFTEGEIVHAEAGEVIGEAAVPVIIGWPDGAFELVPNTTALNRTIEKSFSHLLLDAHRRLDEDRRAPPEPARASAATARDSYRSSFMDQIRSIRGVTQVARFGDDGSSAGAAGPEAEALVAKALYLSVTHARAVATAFGLHDLAIATYQGERESLVLLHGSAGYLCVALAPGVAAEPVAAQLRTILTRPAPR